MRDMDENNAVRLAGVALELYMNSRQRDASFTPGRIVLRQRMGRWINYSSFQKLEVEALVMKLKKIYRQL